MTTASRADMARLLDFVEPSASCARCEAAVPRDARRVRDGADAHLLELLRNETGVVARLARAERIHAPTGADGRPVHSVSRRLGAVEVLLPVDEAYVEKERVALDKEIARAQEEAGAIERKLQTSFVEKAPPDVVSKERSRLVELNQTLAMSRERRESLR